jgi:hypothetical protein
MASTPQSDWRLTNQENYLKGASLSLRKFSIRPEQPQWDHEHCEFCWVKIVVKNESADPQLLTEAYATKDGSHWICPKCLEDFRALFGWIIADEPKA